MTAIMNVLVRCGVAFALSSFLGCSQSEPPPDIDTGADGDADVDADADADGDADGDVPHQDYDVAIDTVQLDPGEERTVCVELRLDNPEATWISAITSRLSEGGHHSILYRSTATEERTEPFDCTPFVQTLCGDNVPLMITQIPEETLAYPAGVGVPIEAHQMMRLEMHFLNATPETITVGQEFTVTTIPESAVEREADFLFVGTPDIDVPAGASETVGPRFIGLPSDLADIEIFAITGHTHQYGTDVSVWRSSSAGDVSDQIYPSGAFQWAEPEVRFFDPPLAMPAGSGLSIQCSWHNTSNRPVGFGESAEAEMCFAWAYYTSARGYRLCFETSQVGFSATACCPGDQTCGLVSNYLGCDD